MQKWKILMINDVLLLTRLSNGNINSRPDTYTIWDAYKYGLESNIENFIAYDYYDLYFENGKKGFEKKIEESINKHNIKFLFIGFAAEDFTFDLNFLVNLKHKYKLCIINTSQDAETFFEARDRYYNQLADYILPFAVFPNGSIYKNYDLETYTLHSLYNKEMFKDLDLEEIYDVTFIGNMNKARRKEDIEFLKKNGINIQTYGAGSENGFISHQEMMKIINSSKINLNFTDTSITKKFDFNTNTNFSIATLINARIPQSKGRLIEIFLTNSFCLSQEGKGTRVLFDDDRIIFDSKEELLEKIKFYLENEEKRREVKKSLHKKALSYDANSKFKEILPKLEYKSKKIKELYVDEEFLRNYTSYHFLFFFNFLFKGKFVYLIEEIKIFIKYRSFDLKTIFNHLKMQWIYAYKKFRKIAK